MKHQIFYLIILCMILSGCVSGIENEFTLSGTIEANNIHAGSRIGGRIAEVYVKEGDTVSEGDVLFRLESDVLIAEKAKVEALLNEAEKSYKLVESGARETDIARARKEADALKYAYELALKGPLQEEINALQAQADAYEAVYINARDNADRMSMLFSEGVISEREYIASLQSSESAKKQWEAMKSQVDALKSKPRDEEIESAKARWQAAENVVKTLANGATHEELESAQARIDTAKKSLERIELDLNEVEVKAPANGIVENFDLLPGDFVSPGKTSVNITDLEILKIVVYVPENRLGYVSQGMEVELTVDSYPTEKFSGRITRVASDAEFTPRNIQTVEERVRQVFAVEIEIQNPDLRLRPGMAVDVVIQTGK